MEILIKDVRFAVRSFLKRPGFLVIAVATLALGIGATTAMFTIVNSVLLRPLQFPEPERIVMFYGINPRQGIPRSNMSMPDIVDWQKQSQSFEQIAGFISTGLFLGVGDETERVRGIYASKEFFPLFKSMCLTRRMQRGEACHSWSARAESRLRSRVQCAKRFARPTKPCRLTT